MLDAAMNNPAPTLALGTIVAWSLWRRLSQIPGPILLVGAGGLVGLMRWNDGSNRTEGERTYAGDYGYARPEEQRTYAADYGRARAGGAMAPRRGTERWQALEHGRDGKGRGRSGP